MTASRGIRLLVGSYPPAWRARYGPELADLLADTGVGVREILDVVMAAVSAWIRPARHLHDRPARMRTSMSVVLCIWTAMAAGSILFAKLTTDAAYRISGAEPSAGWYDAFVAAALVSAAAMTIGAVPVTAAMLRSDRSRSARRLLALPVLAVAALTGITLITTSMVGRGEYGIGAGWFCFLVVAGVAAAAVCAGGPAVAVQRIRVGEHVLRIAVIAGAVATAAMAIAVVDSLVFAASRPHGHVLLPAYGAVMVVALLVASTSSVRGVRAAIVTR